MQFYARPLMKMDVSVQLTVIGSVQAPFTCSSSWYRVGLC